MGVKLIKTHSLNIYEVVNHIILSAEPSLSFLLYMLFLASPPAPADTRPSVDDGGTTWDSFSCNCHSRNSCYDIKTDPLVSQNTMRSRCGRRAVREKKINTAKEHLKKKIFTARCWTYNIISKLFAKTNEFLVVIMKNTHLVTIKF